MNQQDKNIMFGTFDKSGRGVYNWSKTNFLANFTQVEKPETEEEIIAIIKKAKQNNNKIRMIGAGLSYEAINKIDHNGILLSLEQFNKFVKKDENSITYQGGTSLQYIFDDLVSQNMMIPVSPGVIGLQSIAGAIATGTHGQGMQQSTLGDAIEKIRVVLANGEVKEIDKNNKLFGAFMMHYGCLGIITEVTLRKVPLDILTCEKISISFQEFCDLYIDLNRESKYVKAWWFPDTDQVHIWDANESSQDEKQMYEDNKNLLTSISTVTESKLNQTIDNIIKKMALETCDENLEGRQFETVQRFQNCSNVVGNIFQVFCKGIPVPQINCEIAVPIERTIDALNALHQWFEKSTHKPHYPFILRCTGKSKAFLSGAHNREVCWIGFLVYLAKDGSFIQGSFEMMRELQLILEGFQGVPHFGKHFIQDFKFKENLPRWEDFKTIRDQYDPDKIFENEFLKDFFS